MNSPLSCLRLAVICASVATVAYGQTYEGKFAAGIRGGPNIWVNDMNAQRVGFGVEALARYGLSKSVLAGIVGGYDILKAAQSPPTRTIPVSYLRADVYHASVAIWLQLASGNKFSPYLTFGVGAMRYERKDAGGLRYPPSDVPHYSVYAPFGVGFELFVSGNSSLTLDFGYRLISAKTDNVPTGSDTYPTMKFGYTFYFGSNDNDDDDGDGLTNRRERELGTDPKNPDSDGDGLSDGEEVLNYRTDPLKADTDNDGISDSDELFRFGTNPLKADTDGDGLTDGEEISTYNTDPLKVDTDKDGLSDGEEVLNYKTDPLKADTDGDGLSDSSELFGYKTDPTKVDTDGGGVDDGAEVRRGSNPLVASDDYPVKRETTTAPFAVGESIILERIKFGPWSSELSAAAERDLERILETLTLHPDIEVEIRGYTDDSGDRTRNIRVSQQRAEAVKKWLEDKGVATRRLTAKGFGPEDPIAPNTTDAGRSKNRRIVFVRTK